MKIPVTRPLLDLDGRPILMQGSDRPTELGAVLVRALNHNPKGMSPQEALERYRLMQRIVSEPEPDISAEMIGALKQALPQLFGPVVAGQAIAILEGQEVGTPGRQDAPQSSGLPSPG